VAQLVPLSLRCRLSHAERVALGWSEVTHCSKCDHAVFLAADDTDAAVLSMLGQCVKLTPEYEATPIFIGFWEPDPVLDRPVVLRVDLPSGYFSARKRALDGARLYLNRMPSHETLLSGLEQGRPVYLPAMHREEARALSRRLVEWQLVVSYADAAA
jgi:hypothetical protein